MFMFPNYIGACPVSILDYLKIEFQLNTRFVENRVMPNQIFKKKLHGTRVPCNFFFFVCVIAP